MLALPKALNGWGMFWSSRKLEEFPPGNARASQVLPNYRTRRRKNCCFADVDRGIVIVPCTFV